MNETGKERVSRMLTLALVASTLLVAALLIAQCADIYLTGTAPSNLTETGVYIHSIYSREIVAERFSKIAWAVWIWLALLIATLIFRQPKTKAALKPPVADQLALLRARVEATPAMQQEEKKRRIAFEICTALCVICGVMVALYMTDLSHFASRDLEMTVGTMMVHVTPWVVAAFACMMVYEQLNCRSQQREVEEAKKAPKKQPEAKAPKSPKIRNLMRGLLYAAAALLVVAGVMNGGMRDVLVKAVNICTECIGLG